MKKIKEELGGDLKNLSSEIKKNVYSNKEIMQNPKDAIVATQQMTKDLGEDKKINKKKTDSKKSVSKEKMKLPIGKLFSMGKVTENKLFEITKKEIDEFISEKWSQKYKDSIDCKNPKGFSQKAHCQGKKKKSENKESTGSGSAGGFEGPFGFNPNSKFVKDSFKETPKKVETKEATGASSAGSYVTPAAWAKSLNKKDWRGKSKTQIPGGQFVQVKKKCKKFPYCNQGDIKALKLTNEETFKKVIKKVSEKYNISENLILDILMENINKPK